MSMRLSVVSVAMHLSGLEAQHFTNGDQKIRWLYEDSARKLHAASPALSTSSTTSSSGFNSWSSDQNVKDDILSNNASGATTPQKNEILENKTVVIYDGRDILDLGANIRDNSRWNFRPSELPKDPNFFFNNRSQYSRVNGDQVPLHVDVKCEFCNFTISYFD